MTSRYKLRFDDFFRIKLSKAFSLNKILTNKNEIVPLQPSNNLSRSYFDCTLNVLVIGPVKAGKSNIMKSFGAKHDQQKEVKFTEKSNLN